MRSGRAFLVSLAAVLLLLLVSVGSSAGGASTPDLTGSWINPAAPSAPAWAIQASPNLGSVTATWRGSLTHAGLTGNWTGTLDNTGTIYSGRYNIHEAGKDFPGNLTMTILAPSWISLQFQGDNGTASTVELDRGVATAVPAPTDWCASTGGASSGCQTSTPVPAGGDAIEASPDLTAGQDDATVAVDVSGDPASDTDVVSVASAAPYTAPTHAADCVRIAAGVVGLGRVINLDLNGPTQQAFDANYQAYSVTFAKVLIACVAMVNEQAAGGAADLARVSCPVSAIRMKILHQSKRSLKVQGLKRRIKPPVGLTCKRTRTTLTLHFHAKSRKQGLTAVLGRKLLIAVIESRKAKHIAVAKVTFAKH